MPALRGSSSFPMPIGSLVGFSDDNGAFVLEGVPIGAVSVLCSPTSVYWSNGRVDLTLTDGQDATCAVPVIKINPDTPFPMLGAPVEPGVMPARFSVVEPNGPASRAGIRAGDIIGMVDGRDVTMLTPMAVEWLIWQHPSGSTVRLSLSRGGQSVAANLTLTTGRMGP
jgi:hypothetical protein